MYLKVNAVPAAHQNIMDVEGASRGNPGLYIAPTGELEVHMNGVNVGRVPLSTGTFHYVEVSQFLVVNKVRNSLALAIFQPDLKDLNKDNNIKRFKQKYFTKATQVLFPVCVSSQSGTECLHLNCEHLTYSEAWSKDLLE